MTEAFDGILARVSHDGVAFDGELVQGLGRLHDDRRFVATRECGVTVHLAR